MELADRIESLIDAGKDEMIYVDHKPVCGVYATKGFVLVSMINNERKLDFARVESLARELFKRDVYSTVVPTTRIDALVDPIFVQEGLEDFFELYKEAVYSLTAWLYAKGENGAMGCANIVDIESFHRIAEIRGAAQWYVLALLGHQAWDEVEPRFRANQIISHDEAKAAIAAIGKAAGF
jgi:hypothetical protein